MAKTILSIGKEQGRKNIRKIIFCVLYILLPMASIISTMAPAEVSGDVKMFSVSNRPSSIPSINSTCCLPSKCKKIVISARYLFYC